MQASTAVRIVVRVIVDERETGCLIIIIIIIMSHRRRRRQQVGLSEVWGHSQHSSEGPLDSFQPVFAVLQAAAPATIADTAKYDAQNISSSNYWRQSIFMSVRM